MTSGAGRVWLALAALCAGIAAPSRALVVPAVLLGTIALALRRRPVARFTGFLLLVWVAGSLQSARSAEDSALAKMTEQVPRCRIQGRVLEHAGGFGTLVGIERARCEGLVDAARPGLAIVDGAVGEAGGPVHGDVQLLPLSDDAFGKQRGRLGAAAELHDLGLRFGRAAGLHGLAARLRAGLAHAAGDDPAGALLRGLTIGDTAAIDAATMERFRRSGLAHLVAVSGSNLAIVLGAVALLMRGAALWVRLTAGFAVLGFFVLLVGPEPSVLRASAMASVGLFALALGRRREPLTALAFALIALLAWRPGLLYATGLHLSASATAGLVLWARPLENRLRMLSPPVAAALAVTLAAQLGVAPVLALTFGDVSVAGPLANLLAAPAVVPATILGFVTAIVGAPFAAAGGFTAGLAEPFASWILKIGDFFGSLSWASLSMPGPAAAGLGAAVLLAVILTLRLR